MQIGRPVETVVVEPVESPEPGPHPMNQTAQAALPPFGAGPVRAEGADLVQEAAATAPDIAEALLAWRAWSVRCVRPEPVYRLTPIGASFRTCDWRPLEAATATCLAQPAPCNSAPAEDCECGLYALRDPAELLRFSGRGSRFYPVVLGAVSLWGRVVVTERGYRAEHAYPRSLMVMTEGYEPSRFVMRSLRDYAVPLSSRRWEDFGWAIGELHEALLATGRTESPSLEAMP